MVLTLFELPFAGSITTATLAVKVSLAAVPVKLSVPVVSL